MRLAGVRLSERRIEGWLSLTLTSHLLSSLITSVELRYANARGVPLMQIPVRNSISPPTAVVYVERFASVGWLSKV